MWLQMVAKNFLWLQHGGKNFVVANGAKKFFGAFHQPHSLHLDAFKPKINDEAFWIAKKA